MKPSGFIFASDWAVRGPEYHRFTKNQHHDSGKQAFSTLIGLMACYGGFKISECRSVTAQDPGYIWGSNPCRAGSRRGVSGVISASDCPVFWDYHHRLAQNHHPVFTKRRFPLPNGGLTGITSPEISGYSSDAEAGIMVGRGGLAFDGGIRNVPGIPLRSHDDQEQKTREMIHA